MTGYSPASATEFETEALAGALPVGRNSSAVMRLRAVRRATQRLAVHRAARAQ